MYGIARPGIRKKLEKIAPARACEKAIERSPYSPDTKIMTRPKTSERAARTKISRVRHVNNCAWLCGV
jgi:hypothetical protein